MKTGPWITCYFTAGVLILVSCLWINSSPQNGRSNAKLPFVAANDFEVFEHESVKVLVPRYDENQVLFTGEKVEGTINILPMVSNLGLDSVDVGCGCTVIRPTGTSASTHPRAFLELAYSVNTTGRIGDQSFGLMFNFRRANGTTFKVPARLAFNLERPLKLPAFCEPVIYDESSTEFAREIEVSSRVPKLDWSQVTITSSDSDAQVTLTPIVAEVQEPTARLRITGQFPRSTSHAISVGFQSPQFEDNPVISINFQHKNSQFVWKPDVLRFEPGRQPPKLVVQTSELVSVDDMKIVGTTLELRYAARQTGKLIVFEFEHWNGTVDPSSILDDSDGTLTLMSHDLVVAEIPFTWSNIQ